MVKHLSLLPVIILFPVVLAAQGYQLKLLTPGGETPEAEAYTKVEIGLRLPPSVEREVGQWLRSHTLNTDNQNGLNPFDPEDISVEALFFPPGNNDTEPLKRYGFYYKSYRRLPTDAGFTYWEELPEEWPWRIRFSPEKAGDWIVQVSVTVKGQTARAGKLAFTVRPTSRTGRMTITPENTKVLTDNNLHRPFFPIGMNVAIPWYNKGCVASDADQMERQRQQLITIREAGANFTRIVITPKNFAVEWEEAGNYDAPFTVKKNHPESIRKVGRLAVAWELDQTVDLMEKLDLYYLLCFEIHFVYTYNPYFPNDGFAWKNHPYRSLPGVQSVAGCFSDPEARRLYKNRLRYFKARWGYATRMAGFEFINEVEFAGRKLIDGKKVSIYHEPDFHKKLFSWFDEMVRHAKNDLEFQVPLSTSFSVTPKPDDSIPHLFDFITWHRYGKFANINARNRRNEYRKVHELYPDKPVLLGESGLPDEWAKVNRCTSIQFESDLWATAMMGYCGSTLSWWWSYLIDNNHLAPFSRLQNFISGAGLDRYQYTQSQGGYADAGKTTEYHTLVDREGRAAMGWIHNMSVYWESTGADYRDCIAEHGIEKLFENAVPPKEVNNVRIKIYGLEPRTRYRLQWYQPHTGQWMGSKTVRTKRSGNLVLKAGDLSVSLDSQNAPAAKAFLITLPE